MKVYVKREDLDNGVCSDADRCALALALKRKTGRLHAWVGYIGASLGKGENDAWQKLAPQAEKFTKRFDSKRSRKTLKPGWVEVWK